ncbi:hypothetical protein GCM10010919_06270 [Alishewanella longhuensis]|uniref:Toxin co-regulated pilus biosynthesis protein Q C-terminal domain-containing protein n=1 Tax=Alishewanella longhuensis TaxID=1091037 RepID=A0ABQ3L352_9ALTE|nr:TcpQ domain-containing protein [Alishewanella longhuensis]GHG61619.1 hypothetical protein GCM10010919_06270 [Alishewanella longhuensis]
MKIILKLLLLIIVVGVIYLLIIKPEILINPEKPNAAADGFSRFYQNFRNSLQQDNKSDFVINQRDSSEELIIQLRRREQQVIPANINWRGAVTRRRFQAGVTVKDSLESYAQQEQMVLFWTLPRDYVIKQFFETNGSLLDTLQQMAVSIGPDFTKPVYGYFCPKSRALVITDLDDPFLKQHCFATGPNTQQRG